MQRTYRELQPSPSLAHLAQTVESFLSAETPLWWVYADGTESVPRPIACLWLGNGIDQATGDRHSHVFLLYVAPEHRRLGIGSALMHYAETWARQRGDRQISLQVFQSNSTAIRLYQHLGYEVYSLSMSKRFDSQSFTA